MSARCDQRGLVAIVRAQSWGPNVRFAHGRTLTEALRFAAAVWINSEGDYTTVPIPTSVWVQTRAGKWELA